MTDQAKGLLITVIGVLCVVPDALFIRLIEADMFVIAFWRMFLTGVSLAVVMLVLHRHRWPAEVRAVGRSGILYAVCTFVSGVLFAVSVSMTTVANTVFIISAMPVFAAIISWFWLGERISQRMVWTIGGAMLGLGMIIYGSLGEERASILGDLAAVAIAVLFAIALTAARKARANSMVPIIPVAFILGSGIMALFIDVFAVRPQDWWLIALHGGVFIALATCLLSLGPRYITSAEVALLILLESILAPLLIWFVIKEAPSEWALLGGAIVIGVLLISNIVALRRRKRRETA